MMIGKGKWYAPLLPMLLALLLLSACGMPMKKPTGLEPLESEQEDHQTEMGEATEEGLKSLSRREEDSTEGQVVEEATKDNQSKSKSSIVGQGKEQATNDGAMSAEEERLKTNSDGNKQPSKSVTPSKKPAATTLPSSKPAKPSGKENAEEDRQANTIVYSIVISADEIPLAPTEMEIEEGDTVFTALVNITKANKIQMDYRGGQGSTAYIEGIDNVYEFDRGQGSGWMYRVNGVFPDRGAGVVPLEAGDLVEWLYTTNLGEDLNADLQPFRR